MRSFFEADDGSRDFGTASSAAARRLLDGPQNELQCAGREDEGGVLLIPPGGNGADDAGGYVDE